MSRTIILVVALIGLTGCVTLVRLEPVEGAEQLLLYERGYGFLISEQHRSVVGLVADESEYAQSFRLSFSMRVSNVSDEPVEVSEANIAVAVEGQHAVVVPAATLAREAKSAAQWSLVAVSLAGAVEESEAELAGFTDYSGTTSVSVNGPSGHSHASGSFSGTEYDESKALHAKRQVRQDTAFKIDHVNAELQSQLERIDRLALQRTTLWPGDELQGFFVIELPKSKSPERLIQIEVSIGGDVHAFTFREFKL